MNLSKILDLSFSKASRLHRPVLAPLVEGMMNACSAVHQSGSRLSIRQHSPWIQDYSSYELQPGSGGRRGHGRISPRLKTTPWPHGTFSASHLFSWILQTEQLTENNRYVQLVVHLGNEGAVPVDVHHEPFQRRRGGFKCCQLCQSGNWNQSTSLGFVWLHVWSAVILNFGILSL